MSASLCPFHSGSNSEASGFIAMNTVKLPRDSREALTASFVTGCVGVSPCPASEYLPQKTTTTTGGDKLSSGFTRRTEQSPTRNGVVFATSSHFCFVFFQTRWITGASAASSAAFAHGGVINTLLSLFVDISLLV